MKFIIICLLLCVCVHACVLYFNKKLICLSQNRNPLSQLGFSTGFPWCSQKIQSPYCGLHGYTSSDPWRFPLYHFLHCYSPCLLTTSHVTFLLICKHNKMPFHPKALYLLFPLPGMFFP
ncbi:hypothetical protein H1C71_031475 [Ictidomys tridecemlineatus]|nr:hypothetical protein H1C71_031475 [Ictidomys tridecemlineatus]